MSTYIVLIICASVGVLLRFFINTHYSGTEFPWGTLIVNVLGSFFMGLYYGQQMSGHPWFPSVVNTGITVGLLGALTTYSTFSIDTIRLLQNGLLAFAGINILANTFLSLIFCYLGIRIISFITTHIAP